MLLRLPAVANSLRRSLSILRAASIIAAQPLDLVVALGEQAALIAEPHFQLLDAPAENLGFGGLHDELPLELRGARAEAVELAARVGQVGRRRIGVAALAGEPFLGLLHRAFVVGDADLHGFDLRAQGGELDALTVGGDRVLAEFGDELRQLRLLVGEQRARPRAASWF